MVLKKASCEDVNLTGANSLRFQHWALVLMMFILDPKSLLPLLNLRF